jgi:uncharacterized protein (TIGR02453 family)
LVLDVGQILAPLIPNLVADPRTDRSIYRLYRDTRFSRDKSPYKDWLALTWFLNTSYGRLESPCFYFHLTGYSFLWSVGCYRFCPPVLERWPTFLTNPEKGSRLAQIIERFDAKNLIINEPHLKRLPAGFDKNHPLAKYSRYRGLYTLSAPQKPAPELFTPEAGHYLANIFLLGRDLFDWLAELYLGLEPPQFEPKRGRGRPRGW